MQRISPYVFAGLIKVKPRMSRKITYIPNRIIKSVKYVTGVDLKDIKSKSRIKHITEARHLLNYCLRKYTYLTTKEVGKITNRDHASVLHSKKVIESDMFYEPQLYRITSSLKGKEIKEDTNILKVKEAVLEATGVKFKDAITKSKVRALADARHLTAYFLNKKTELNVYQVCLLMDRDYSATSKSINRVDQLQGYDSFFTEKVMEINQLLCSDQ